MKKSRQSYNLCLFGMKYRQKNADRNSGKKRGNEKGVLNTQI